MVWCCSFYCRNNDRNQSCIHNRCDWPPVQRHLLLYPSTPGSGFYIFPSAIIARLIVVLEWLSFTFNVDSEFVNSYFYFRDTYCFGRFDVFVTIIIAVIGVFYWFYREFKKQLKTVDEKAE